MMIDLKPGNYNVRITGAGIPRGQHCVEVQFTASDGECVGGQHTQMCSAYDLAAICEATGNTVLGSPVDLLGLDLRITVNNAMDPATGKKTRCIVGYHKLKPKNFCPECGAKLGTNWTPKKGSES